MTKAASRPPAATTKGREAGKSSLSFHGRDNFARTEAAGFLERRAAPESRVCRFDASREISKGAAHRGDEKNCGEKSGEEREEIRAGQEDGQEKRKGQPSCKVRER